MSLQEYRLHMEKGIAAALSRAGSETLAAAIALCPVGDGREGHLRDSIALTVEGDAAEVSASSPHAAYVEFGTARAKAQPYLSPAFREGEKIFLQMLKELKNE